MFTVVGDVLAMFSALLGCPFRIANIAGSWMS